jgi:hypothetical protein
MSTTNTNTDTNKDERDDHKKKRHSGWYIILLAIWIFLGIFAYASAFTCTHERYTGGDARKIGMLFLAAILGPFYWLIYPLARSDGYCHLKQ